MRDLERKIDALTEQVAALTERQRAQAELFEEMVPIAKAMMSTASEKLGALESRGYFAFGKELLSVVDTIVTHYTPEDVADLSQSVVTILDAVRAMTQPHVLEVAKQAGAAVEGADTIEPVGMMGMVKASRDEAVQRGMAVMLDVLRQVGHGAAKADRRERLRRQLASRKSPAVSRPRAVAAPRAATPVAATPKATAPKAAAPPASVTAKAPASTLAIAGVELTDEGFMVDAKAWNRDIAQTIASSMHVGELTDKHWQLIDFARKDYFETGASPNIRRLTKGSGIDTKDVYTMFPKAPGKTCAKIAGLPKPVGCI